MHTDPIVSQWYELFPDVRNRRFRPERVPMRITAPARRGYAAVTD